MKYVPLILATSVFLSSQLYVCAASAQTEAPIEIENNAAPLTIIRKTVRKVEPIPYWVEAEQLPIRDNPVAGDVSGMLKLGEKITAYGQFENWLRVSKSGSTEKWVNGDYLTTDQLTWARFDNKRRRSAGFSRNNTVDDVSLKRIKVSGDKNAHVYSASVKTTQNNNRIIVTRQNFRAGHYFEKRLVACDENGVATRFQLLGEGHSYMMMEKDIRAQGVDINSAVPRADIFSDGATPKTIAIANFSCQK